MQKKRFYVESHYLQSIATGKPWGWIVESNGVACNKY